METIGIKDNALATAFAKTLLERKGYGILNEGWMHGRDGVVAIDPEGVLVFALAAMSDPHIEGFEPVPASRETAETWAFDWLVAHASEIPDAPVRFDVIQVKATATGKGFARHTINALGAGD